MRPINTISAAWNIASYWEKLDKDASRVIWELTTALGSSLATHGFTMQRMGAISQGFRKPSPCLDR